MIRGMIKGKPGSQIEDKPGFQEHDQLAPPLWVGLDHLEMQHPRAWIVGVRANH